MDPDSSFNLEIRIVARNCRARWFSLNQVVDADRTQFRDLLANLVEKYPHEYGDKVSLFFFCTETKSHIPVCNDQDLVEMFAKHRAIKTCLLNVAYHSPSSEPPVIPDWDCSNQSTVNPVQPPFTPSIACPSLVEATSGTLNQSAEHQSVEPHCDEIEYLCNQCMSMWVLMMKVCTLIWVQTSPLLLLILRTKVGLKKGKVKVLVMMIAMRLTDYESSDEEVEDIDDEIKDKEPENMPDAFYDKNDPPMTVKKVPFPHECQSTRRQGICVGVTQFWVCSQVIDWLKEDGNIGPTELQRRLKEHHKIVVPYKRVYKGKYLAMDKIYGP
ncbi:hypothetical protein DAI22_01g198650 [Oryza sativa Japonica Group]|nr:hypothetical protein DAI22_01g198650 [Oryza sativa Japonica Group]